MDMEFELKEEKKKEPRREENNYELADRLYVFCPEIDKGIEVIVQSLSPHEEKFSGALPDGFILSSGVRGDVSWIPDYRGIKKIGYVLDDEITARDQVVKSKTIVVSRESFMDLISQIKTPKIRKNGYYLLDLRRCIADIKNAKAKKETRENKLTGNSKYIKNKKF